MSNKLHAFIASERKLLEATTPGPTESLAHWNQLYWLRMGFLDSISVLQRVDGDEYKMTISLLDAYVERNLPKLDSPYKTTRSFPTSHAQALDALEIAMKRIEVLREFLDQDIAGLECHSRVRTMDEDTWSQAMYLRDVADEDIARIEKLVEKKS